MKSVLRSMIMLLLILVLVGTTAPQVAAQTISGELDQIVAELLSLEPYVHYAKIKGVQVQVLDTRAAQAAGYSNQVIKLASEMVAYQNELVAAKTNNLQTPKAERYLQVKQFFDLATAKRADGATTPSGSLAVTAVNACGDWSHPVPNYTPKRYPSSAVNPAASLIKMGFHNTASYACGFGNCSSRDFTRGRSYTGPYGTCSSPRFRDQGLIIGPTAFNIQYGEPNPEILSYGWPYWNWGAYVQWWHRTY